MISKRQIEEMAKTLCANCRKDGYSCSLYSSDDDWVCAQERERAEFFYNAGYRKIPENAVVLTPAERDEEMRLIRQDVIERLEVTRKELVKEILQCLEERKERVKDFYGIAESVGVDIAIRVVKKILKEITEGKNE